MSEYGTENIIPAHTPLDGKGAEKREEEKRIMLSLWLFVAASVLLACILLKGVSGRLGVPVILIFILLGLLMGSNPIFRISLEDYDLTEAVCSTALIFIMFYGGFGTNWKRTRPMVVRAGLLATAGMVCTALLTGLFCHFVMDLSFPESMLLGAVMSSTDSTCVFSIFKAFRLRLKYNTDSLLELESGSNDPFACVLTVALLAVINGTAQGGQLVLLLLQQVGIGTIFGFLMAKAALWCLRRLRFADSYDTIFIFSAALLTYAASAVLGGNGYLSVYIAGILLGNQELKCREDVDRFFDALTGMMQILVFFLLGLLAVPGELVKLAVPALLTALFLTFVARPLVVYLFLLPFRCPLKQKLLVSWSGLRGASSIVFAIMATIDPAVIRYDVFHFAFCIVLFSISVQGTLLPLVARKLDMLETEEGG